MQKANTVWDTGALSEEVNALILFTDNTPALVAIRDKAYQYYFDTGGMTGPELLHNLEILLYTAIGKYFKEFKTSFRLTQAQKADYIKLYREDFNNWKTEKYGKSELT